MPSTRNLKHLNLNMCFSNSTTPESKSPPTSPIHATSSPYASSPSIMIKNFNSLYDPIATSSTFDNFSSFTTTTTSTSSEPEPADFAAAFASQRFFFTSPGPSNSLTNCNKHSSSPLMATNTNDDNHIHNPNGSESEKKSKKALFNGSVAVSTYSPDPYLDFRRSMQEMVEARPELMDVKSNWKILHELLLCYLALNPKSTHKFILGAFADLLVSLMPF
ncbi:Ovate protein family, C-terminal [Sesbania bispinosa]|nr:Ovate protein family, C-terminal [Sesbania bispinosa]